MKRVLRRCGLLVVILAFVGSWMSCARQSWDLEARWNNFANHMANISRSVDYHVFNYDWDDPYLP